MKIFFTIVLIISLIMLIYVVNPVNNKKIVDFITKIITKLKRLLKRKD